MRYKKEDLERMIITEGKSYEFVGRVYGVTGSAIRKALNVLGLYLPDRRRKNPSETFNKGASLKKKEINICVHCTSEFIKYPLRNSKFCSPKCKTENYIDRWKMGEETGLINGYGLSSRIRNYMFETHSSKCEKCSWGEVNTYSGLVPLQIHHIDGDCQNNTEENLQLLCPNCHCLTDNYGSRNKNATKGRGDYYDRHKKRNSN